MRGTILFLIILLAIPNALDAADQQLVDQVIAVVNDEVITQNEFDLIFHPIYQHIKETYEGKDLGAYVQEVRLKLLNQMIEDKLVYQEAEKLGIKVLDSEIEEQVNDFKAKFPDEETFQHELELAGLSVSELKQQFRERIAIARLHQYRIRNKVIVSPAEVEQYFQEHQKEFGQKEEVEVWCMTIPKSEAAIQEGLADEAAKRKAEDLLSSLKKGADFGELAKVHSNDAYAKQGGYLGFIEKGDFAEDIEQVIFSLPSGTFSDVFETKRAYHLFKVGDKKTAVQKTFDEAREEVEGRLFQLKAHKRFVEWMQELKEKSYISIR